LEIIIKESYQVSTDSLQKFRECLSGDAIYKNIQIVPVDIYPFIATTTTTTKFLQYNAKQKPNRFFIFQP
jgi:hypothetical protein